MLLLLKAMDEDDGEGGEEGGGGEEGTSSLGRPKNLILRKTLQRGSTPFRRWLQPDACYINKLQLSQLRPDEARGSPVPDTSIAGLCLRRWNNHSKVFYLELADGSSPGGTLQQYQPQS